MPASSGYGVLMLILRGKFLGIRIDVSFDTFLICGGEFGVKGPSWLRPVFIARYELIKSGLEDGLGGCIMLDSVMLQ